MRVCEHTVFSSKLKGRLLFLSIIKFTVLIVSYVMYNTNTDISWTASGWSPLS